MIPALEILPDALRGQAGHPLLSSSPLSDASGACGLGGGPADVAACAGVEAASGKPDLSYITPACPRIDTPARTADLNNLSRPQPSYRLMPARSLDRSSSICHRSVTNAPRHGLLAAAIRARSRGWNGLQLLFQKNKSGGVAAPRSSGEP